jgi:hypothetical protein
MTRRKSGLLFDGAVTPAAAVLNQLLSRSSLQFHRQQVVQKQTFMSQPRLLPDLRSGVTLSTRRVRFSASLQTVSPCLTVTGSDSGAARRPQHQRRSL